VITYSTNMMGPVSMDWFRERGLTKIKSEVLEEDHPFSGLKKGQTFDFENITTYYAGGRIDIRGVPGDDYWNGWHEYSIAIMHGEDWNDLGDWLESFQTHELWEFDDIIAKYEGATGRKIRWAEDTWYKCYECGLVTDLRENKEHIHKLDCTRNWNER